MSSRSGFLHTFCAYVVHEFMFSELERRPGRRVTIICRSRDWVVSWYAMSAWSTEGCWTWERLRRSITAVCWNSFYDLNEKIGKLVVIEVESTDVVETGETLNLLETQEVRLVSWGTCAWRERPLTTREFDRWLEETVTSSQPVLLHGELWVESTVASFESSPTGYRVACWRDIRPTFLKDTLWGEFCFYYSFIL